MFEVVVENEQVKTYMEKMAPRVEKHMRQQLHNRQIAMTVRIAAPTDTPRVTSKPQQLQAMAQRNPALLKLKETFGLELN